MNVINRLFFLFTFSGVFVLLFLGCTEMHRQKTLVRKVSTVAGTRNDAWEFVGAGGGGAMFFPAVSPFNPDYAFVACDMSCSFVTYNRGKSWRMFNLHGPVRYFVFDPCDSNIVYAKSVALFKSSDRGKTWEVFYPSPSEITGIVAKGDHAEEIVVTRDSVEKEVLAFAVDPEDSKTLFASIKDDKRTIVYSSKNGGLNWEVETVLLEPSLKIFVDPSSPRMDRTLYIAGASTITVRKNGNWTVNSVPLGVVRINEYTGGFDTAKNTFIIYAISGLSYFNPKGDKSGIFMTDDGGKSWINQQSGMLKYVFPGSGLPEWRCIAACAGHPETVYLSYNSLIIHPDSICFGVAKSEDYGKTWNLVWKDAVTKKGNVFSPNFEGGWIDERFGPTWGENPFSIGVAPGNPDICYATDFGRTVISDNGGRKWYQAYTRKKEGAGWISRGLDVTTGYNVVFDPFDKQHVFIANTDIGLMESKDAGESWYSATYNNGIPQNWINSTYWLEFDPDVPGRAWAAMSDIHDLPRPKMWRRQSVSDFTGGIVMTDDAGKTWKPVSSSAGEAAFTHILVDPSSDKSSRVLYACAFGKGVFKSCDGGKTWELKNNGIAGKEPFAWRIIRRKNDGVLFLIIQRRSDDGSIGTEMDGAIYRSDDHAETWKKVLLPYGTNGPTSLEIDPENPQRFLLSAWGRVMPGKFAPDMGGGIFLSTDEGHSWKQVLGNDQHIHDITYDERNGTFYACGFNGSAYRSNNKGVTWKRIKGYNFKWGKRVVPDPENPEMIFIVTFGGGIWYGPAQGDEKAIEDIVTPIFQRK